MFYVLMIVSGLSLPMPDMATCEDAAFFLRYSYYKRPICTAVQDPNYTRVDLRQSKSVGPTKDDTCRICIERGWSAYVPPVVPQPRDWWRYP